MPKRIELFTALIDQEEIDFLTGYYFGRSYRKDPDIKERALQNFEYLYTLCTDQCRDEILSAMPGFEKMMDDKKFAKEIAGRIFGVIDKIKQVGDDPETNQG